MKPIPNTKVIILFSALFVIVFTVIYYIQSEDKASAKILVVKPLGSVKKSFHSSSGTPAVLQRIVHLDLKGAPPKIAYYSHLFPLLNQLGATGVLLEYDDMFPYNGRFLNNVSALNAYTLSDIKTINGISSKSNLKLIPFINVCSHLEFILKLKEFVDFREVSSFPSTICPSYNKTLSVLEDLVGQIIEAHPNSDMIHIGCNEVPDLGHCQRCRDRMLANNLTKSDLFLDHVRALIRIIKSKKSHIEILMWDDHFRAATLEEILRDPLVRSFKPVVWWYGKDVEDELGPSLWSMYSSVFPSVWLATAYKGATGSDKYISDVNHYVQNHKSWLSLINEYSRKIRFEGVILTGWQRYDHFAVLCELLPVALPTLAMNLRLLQGFKDPALGPPMEVAKILQCEQPYGLMGSAFGSPKCKFPGGDILETVIHFHQLRQEFEEISDDTRVKGWLSEFNKAHSFSNPRQVKGALLPLDKIKDDLELIKSRLVESVLKVYDQYTVHEWLDTYLVPFEREVVALWQAKERILKKAFWPKKPLNFDEEL